MGNTSDRQDDEFQFTVEIVQAIISIVQARFGNIGLHDHAGELVDFLNEAASHHESESELERSISFARSGKKDLVKGFINPTEKALLGWKTLTSQQREALCADLFDRWGAPEKHLAGSGTIIDTEEIEKRVDSFFHDILAVVKDHVSLFDQPGNKQNLFALEVFAAKVKEFWQVRLGLKFGQLFEKRYDSDGHIVPANSSSMFLFETARCLNPAYTPQNCQTVMTKLNKLPGN